MLGYLSGGQLGCLVFTYFLYFAISTVGHISIKLFDFRLFSEIIYKYPDMRQYYMKGLF
jgi:hypothetical protein